MSVYPLVYQQPQQCFCAPESAAGWPNGPGRGPPISFTSSSDQGYRIWAVAGSSKEEDFLTGYEAVPAMPQPNTTAHARLTQTTSTCAPLTSGIPREMRRSISMANGNPWRISRRRTTPSSTPRMYSNRSAIDFFNSKSAEGLGGWLSAAPNLRTWTRVSVRSKTTSPQRILTDSR